MRSANGGSGAWPFWLGCIRWGLLLVAMQLVAGCRSGDPDPVDGVPTPPSNVQAIPGRGFITVTWSDNSDDELGFVVFRRTLTGPGSDELEMDEIAAVEADRTVYRDDDVRPDATYRYAVTAEGPGGIWSPVEHEGPAVAPLRRHQLELAVAGSGLGHVASDPGGIFCRPDCSEALWEDQELLLIPVADPSSYFAGWSGGPCDGEEGECLLVLNEPATITARFEPNANVVSVFAPSGPSFLTRSARDPLSLYKKSRETH